MSTDSPFGGGGSPRNPQPDFFASPTSRPAAPPAVTPQPSAPAPFAPPQLGTPPASSPFGTPPASPQFGTPPVFPAAYPPMPYAPLAPRRSGMPGWAIAAICIPLAVVLVLVLAAVAIPVFLNQRGKAVVASTSVSLPPTVADLTAVNNSAAQAEFSADIEAMSVCGCFERPMLGMYADKDASHYVVVIAAKFTRPARAEDQNSVSGEIWKGIRDGAAPNGLTFGPAVAADPGRLGGTVTCAPATSGGQGRACVAVDPASFVAVLELDSQPLTDAHLPTTVREAVVHRT